MDLNKEFLYNNDKIILLFCDFYETSQIPQSMFDIKDNITLFPIVNIPLIEFILTNLEQQKFRNIVLVGSKIDSLVEYISNTRFIDSLNIRILRSFGSSLGDTFREIDQLGYEFKDLIVMYANHYTNVPLNRLLKKHKQCKDNLMTIFSYPYKSNNTSVHVYATHKNNIIFYAKTTNGKMDSSEVAALSAEYKTFNIDTSASSPTIAVVSNDIFSLFTENFDYNTFGDLISGILATKLYSYKFQIVNEDDLQKSSSKSSQVQQNQSQDDSNFNNGIMKNILHNVQSEIIKQTSKEIAHRPKIHKDEDADSTFDDCIAALSETLTLNGKTRIYSNTPDNDVSEETFNRSYQRCTDHSDLFQPKKDNEYKSTCTYYSREINTVLDYYNFNRDLLNDSTIIKVPDDIVHSILGEVEPSITVESSTVGPSSSIAASITNCIVWDNCQVQEVFSDYIVIGNDMKINVFHLESDGQESQELGSTQASTRNAQSNTFFEDFSHLLCSNVATAQFYDIDITSINKEISLLRIVWNASRHELIEAFANFFVSVLNSENLEDSISRASVYFGILSKNVISKEDGELLMECMYDNLSEYDLDFKVQVLFNYGYLFVQDNIVDKSVVKKYNKMYKAGTF
jgi:NDP-sugar pyrophosphorylase family protein